MLSVASGGGWRLRRSLTLQPSSSCWTSFFRGFDPLTVKDLQDLIRELSRSGIGIDHRPINVGKLSTVTDRAICESGKIMKKVRRRS